MQGQTSVSQTLANNIIDRVEDVVLEAEEQTKPLELDPYRGQLFELFVTAEATGLIQDGADPDLTADGIGRQLALRWQLDTAARDSVELQSKMPAEHLSKMRMLWSFMRMWMEWSYAWQRWAEFHETAEQR